MVTIVKHNEKEIWGLFDSKNHTLVKWSNGWEFNGEYSFNIEVGIDVVTSDNLRCFEAFSKDKILENIKLLDVSSGTLPLSYEDAGGDIDFYDYIFKMEDKEGGIALQIELENHGTPWLMGDCYEMQTMSGLEQKIGKHSKDGTNVPRTNYKFSRASLLTL